MQNSKCPALRDPAYLKTTTIQGAGHNYGAPQNGAEYLHFSF